MASENHAQGYRRGPLRHVFPSPSRPIGWRRAAKTDSGYGACDANDWREIDWLAHQHQAEIAGRTVNYVDIGSGDAVPLVFVHGLGGCWQNWLENIPRIAAQRRVIALDLPGFGASQMPIKPISITNFAATVDLLCDLLGFGTVALVGNSMGGFTAAEVAIRHPERVECLVLVDAAGISITSGMDRLTTVLARFITPSIPADGDRTKRIFSRPAFTQGALGSVMRHPTRLKKDLLAEQVQGSGKPGFASALEALLSYDFKHRLCEISCPTLIVQGSEDFLVPLGDAYEFNRLIAGSTTLIMEDTGHVPMIERPLAFNDALVEFVSHSETLGSTLTPAKDDAETSAG